MSSVQTNHGLAGLVGFALFLVLVMHFIGVRVVFAAGRPA